MIHPNLAEFIDQYRIFNSPGSTEDAVEQGGLARSQPPGKQGDRGTKIQRVEAVAGAFVGRRRRSHCGTRVTRAKGERLLTMPRHG